MRELRRALEDSPPLYRHLIDIQVGAAAVEAEMKTKSNIRSKTGRLRSAVGRRRLGEMNYQVYIDLQRAPYGRFVEEGTRPHVISARNVRALRFSTGGSIVFAKNVKHPGTKPVRMLRRGVSEAWRGLEQRWAQRIEDFYRRRYRFY